MQQILPAIFIEHYINISSWYNLYEEERSSGEENGNPLQYSCMENSMDRGAWWATVHGVQRVGHE